MKNTGEGGCTQLTPNQWDTLYLLHLPTSASPRHCSTGHVLALQAGRAVMGILSGISGGGNHSHQRGGLWELDPQGTQGDRHADCPVRWELNAQAA